MSYLDSLQSQAFKMGRVGTRRGDMSASEAAGSIPGVPGSSNRLPSRRFEEVKNPWEDRFNETYTAAKADPYGQDWRTAVSKAMALGNRDYEGDLKRFAAENVDRQQLSADNQLGAYGMREMALRGDVQQDRTKQRTDADTRAVIESQGIKTNALDTMRSMLAGASGTELARIAAMISAASAGGANSNQFQAMMAALQERLGANGGGE